MTHACVYGFAADKQIATRVDGLGGLLNGTVAILAQGTSWADAATQAFLRKVGICTEKRCGTARCVRGFWWFGSSILLL